MTFDFQSLRLSFVARETIQFPAIIPANILRGGFGLALRRIACNCAMENVHDIGCLYSRFFEPTTVGGPSGLRDSPRPFVFRAQSLDGRTLHAGESFCFGMHVFESGLEVGKVLEDTFSLLASEGLGPGRGRSELTSFEIEERSLDLKSSPAPVSELRVRFLTPTELKGGEEPSFSVLFARTRDRLSTLRELYGSGPLDLDFKAMGLRAAGVSTTRRELKEQYVTRKSTRTGQSHSLSGFTGTIDYAGALEEFLPFLDAAQWTGVGRQTVWGKGELKIQDLCSGC